MRHQSTDFQNSEEEGNLPRPRLKRLLRISIRMVFVLTTILCVWLGYKVHQVKARREAVAWVRENGGIIEYHDPPGPQWAHRLVGIDFFAPPAGVAIDADITDLSMLAALPSLSGLRVTSNSARDLSPLANLRDLEFLDLECREVEDFSPLVGLTKLKHVILPESAAEDDIAALHKALPKCEIYQHEGSWAVRVSPSEGIDPPVRERSSDGVSHSE